MDPEQWLEAQDMKQAFGITDDRCVGRCADLRDWFTFETRGLMDSEESHNVLDMLLNRLASDAPPPIEHWGVTGDHGGIIDFQTRERPARIAAAEGRRALMRRHVTEWAPAGTQDADRG